MMRFLKRSAETAVKLPFAIAWDVISLGNMGDGSSTGRVIREHQVKKEIDEICEIVKRMNQCK